MTYALVLGLLIGMRHALEADHVAAVASLVMRSRTLRGSIHQGAVWGLGHTVTLFMVGSFVVLSGTALAPVTARLLEGSVAVMLILLGLDVLVRMVRKKVHFHVHQHPGGERHFHAHRHERDPDRRHSDAEHSHEHLRLFPGRALFIGLMHGLAGSAALVILALHSTETVWQGLMYLVMFGLGSVIGMALLSAGMAIPLLRSEGRFTRLNQGVQAVVGVANIGIGLWLLFQVLGALN